LRTPQITSCQATNPAANSALPSCAEPTEAHQCRHNFLPNLLWRLHVTKDVRCHTSLDAGGGLRRNDAVESLQMLLNARPHHLRSRVDLPAIIAAGDAAQSGTKLVRIPGSVHASGLSTTARASEGCCTAGQQPVSHWFLPQGTGRAGSSLCGMADTTIDDERKRRLDLWTERRQDPALEGARFYYREWHESFFLWHNADN
jgi:hypothetical protein